MTRALTAAICAITLAGCATLTDTTARAQASADALFTAAAEAYTAAAPALSPEARSTAYSVMQKLYADLLIIRAAHTAAASTAFTADLAALSKIIPVKVS